MASLCLSVHDLECVQSLQWVTMVFGFLILNVAAGADKGAAILHSNIYAHDVVRVMWLSRLLACWGTIQVRESFVKAPR